MVRVLVVQHAASDPPGLVGAALQDAGIGLDLVRPYLGERLPPTVRADGLVVLGGEMSAFDDARAPWLPAARRLLAEAAAGGVPTWGICLGAQLLAVASGGTVVTSHPNGPEVGLSTVSLTHAARDDPLLAGLGQPVRVVQWHFDGVTALPPGAVLLAASRRYPIQAFRLGRSAWGVQWHPEVDRRTGAAWVAAGGTALASLGLDPRALHAELAGAEEHLAATWRPVAARFGQLVRTVARRRAG